MAGSIPFWLPTRLISRLCPELRRYSGLRRFTSDSSSTLRALARHTKNESLLVAFARGLHKTVSLCTEDSTSQKSTMAETTHDFPNLSSLRAAISNTPPFCSGTLDVHEDNYLLFYKTPDGNRVGYIDFAKSSEAQLDALVDACEAATFGLNSKNVLDATYRRAWKMDSKCFSPKLNLEETGILGIIRARLLEGPNENKLLKAELYKLNVYGKGSFFKTHQDTPRNANMFGSLVIVFPTPHKGGSLLMNHHEEKWEFDSSKVIEERGQPCLGYVALFSDVEHEVMKVESGHRVTLTYNLYFTEDHIPSEISPVVPDFENLKTALSNALDQESFLPDGGLLGFGLRHMYPVKVSYQNEETFLNDLLEGLKGSDAVIRQACQDLSLDVSVKAIYSDADWENPNGTTADRLVMCDRVVDLSEWRIDTYISEALCEYQKAVVIHDAADPGSRMEEGSTGVYWVTPFTTFSNFKSDYVAYGNEESVAHFYGNICLIAKIGPPGARSLRNEAASTASI